MPKNSIVIVDDEKELLEGLKLMLKREFPDLIITTTVNPLDALELVKSMTVSMVLSDIRMPQMDGLDLLREIKKADPGVSVLIMTAFGTIETAVEAVRAGAYDFICKPFDYDLLFNVVRRGFERSSLIRENIRLKRRISDRTTFANFVGQSKPMLEFYENIQAIARTNYTVLVRGESGTGKELTSKAIHQQSKRKDGPLVMINCPAIPEHLLESELFGHKKGAFTGADFDRIGLFEEANGGTICLDEIGDIPISVQVKLLRVLQEGEIRPLGSTKSVNIDVRVVAVTNQNLEEKISNGSFRNDLYFRLNVVTIWTPKLDNIREDIPLLANHFCKMATSEQEIDQKKLTPAALDYLTCRKWPGNVRELQNAIRRSVIFCQNEDVGPENFSFQNDLEHSTKSDSFVAPQINEIVPYKDAKENVLQSFGSMYLEKLLTETEGNVTKAAELSELSRAAFQKIMRRYDVKSDNFRRVRS